MHLIDFVAAVWPQNQRASLGGRKFCLSPEEFEVSEAIASLVGSLSL